MGKRLFVGNLAYSVTEADLRDTFAESGSVTEVKIVLDRDTGRPRGFAFVEMSSDAEAEKAIGLLNERSIQGRPISVKEALERSGGAGGGRAGAGRAGGGQPFGAGGGGGGYGGNDRDRGNRRNRW